MPMGMGGGFDSSGPEGLGADAFGGEEGFNRISFYMDDAFSKIALKAKESPAYTAHLDDPNFSAWKQNIMSLYEAWDPQGQYKHNPHLDSLEPGVYDFGRVPYGQLRDLGLISQYEYDQYNMLLNSKMDTGKNFPLHEQPGVLEYNVPTIPTQNNLTITQDPLVSYAVPLNPPVPMNMDVEELNWIDMPLPNPDLNSVPTGPGSYGWGGGSSR